MRSVFKKAIVLTAFALSSTKALAGPGGGAIVFGTASPVPTLSGAMMILLGLFLAFIAFKVFKEKSGSNVAFLVAALSSGAALSIGGGIKIVDSTEAGLAGVSIIPNTTMVINPGPNLYTNNTGGPQSVLSITLPAGCLSPTAIGPEPMCTVGLSVPPTSSCSIICSGGGS